MAQRPQERAMTVEELYALPEDGRLYELEAGRLVSEPLPGFRHGRVAARLAHLLTEHAERHALGVVLSNDTGYVLARSPDTVRGPDVSFVRHERVTAIGDVAEAFPGPPDLAVEVLSPSNTAAGIHAKVADYLAAGARLVWVAEPEHERVTVYRALLSPRTLTRDDELEGEDVLPGFKVKVGEIFRVDPGFGGRSGGP